MNTQHKAIISNHQHPSESTIAAINEARSGKKLEALDLDNFQNYVASL